MCVCGCSGERVPLLLKGQGIGPKATFSYDELDVGDLFIGSKHKYEVDLISQVRLSAHCDSSSALGLKLPLSSLSLCVCARVCVNLQGDIAVNYSLQPLETAFGPKFRFTPDSGRLEVGESVTITVDFVPDLLGDFCETFTWILEGSAAPITVTFRVTEDTQKKT